MADDHIPEFRYFPVAWMEKYGPRSWARRRFLETCRRLLIPEDKWPAFSERTDFPPRDYATSFPTTDHGFVLPSFNFVAESVTEWRTRAETLFRARCDKYLATCLEIIEGLEKDGYYTRIEIVRDKNTPINLRYEWAARRHCLGEQFKSMSSDAHSADKIRKAVYKVFDDTGIPYKRK